MQHSSGAPVRLGVLVLAIAATTTGCGFGVAIPPIGPPPTPTATILVDLPPGLREAAHLAIDHADHDPAAQLNGLALMARDMDDSRDGKVDPKAAAARFQALVDGSHSIQYVGMVGPLNPDVARAEMPIASRANFPIVSPSLTADCLTQTQHYCRNGEPAVLYPNGSVNHAKGLQFFFRDATTESAEGPAAADYAYQTLNSRTAFVVDDHTALGAELAAGFTSRFDADGGTVAGTATVDVAKGASPDASAVRKAHADAVFFAGSGDSGAAGARRAALQGGASTFIAGGAVDRSSAFIAAAGGAAEGCYAVSLEPDPTYSAQAAGAASDYLQEIKARYPAITPSGWGLNAYLATLSLVDAIAGASSAAGGQVASRPVASDVRIALSGGGSLGGRPIVVDGGDNYGRISFDSDGDTIDKVLSVHMVRDGRWQFKDQMSFTG